MSSTFWEEIGLRRDLMLTLCITWAAYYFLMAFYFHIFELYMNLKLVFE